MNLVRRSVVAVAAGGGLLVAGAAPALAQPLVTGGLVNVTVANSLNDVLSNNNVAVGAALNVAANVCGVAVNVLATQLGTPGPITCSNPTTGQTVTIRQLQ